MTNIYAPDILRMRQADGGASIVLDVRDPQETFLIDPDILDVAYEDRVTTVVILASDLREEGSIHVLKELFEMAGRMQEADQLISLEYVDRIGTAVLEALLKLQRLIQKKNGRLILCRVPPHIRSAFETGKMRGAIQIVDTQDDGLRAFERLVA